MWWVLVVGLSVLLIWLWFFPPVLSEVAEGKVLSVGTCDYSWWEDPAPCEADIWFRDGDGASHVFRSETAGRIASVGDAVNVYYDPEDAARASTKRVSKGFGVGLYVLFGLVLFRILFRVRAARRGSQWLP